MCMNYNDTTTGILVVSRHGESEWNLLGRWTGRTDVSITEKGKNDSALLGALLKDIDFDLIFTSDLKRTRETLAGILEGKGSPADSAYTAHKLLTERDYGDLTGMNKWEVKEKIGEAEFNGIRRGWDHPVPGGETLKDVHGRTIPYFDDVILPELRKGKNVLLVSHGNTIRALMKHLEDINETDMATVEMPLGVLLIYHFAPDSDKPHKKEVRKADITPSHA